MVLKKGDFVNQKKKNINTKQVWNVIQVFHVPIVFCQFYISWKRLDPNVRDSVIFIEKDWV